MIFSDKRAIRLDCNEAVLGNLFENLAELVLGISQKIIYIPKFLLHEDV